MSTSIHAASPFDMLVNPQAILNAIEHAERSHGLTRKVCRPLDKPIAPRGTEGDAAAAFDAAIDRLAEVRSI
ncbi:MAG TPA: hypothetical protein VN277_00310 [Acidiferrobacterales bacterium]|nr:hypothetical protein [Acidiferrobacterales bacterium]